MKNAKLAGHVAIAILGPLALLAGACGGDDEPELLTITATDFAFAVDGELTPGTTEIRLENDGQFEHHVQLLRIDGEQTAEEAIEAIEGPPVDWLIPYGGVAPLAPGESAAVVDRLPAGRYALVCFIDEPDGVPHFAKGMVAEFTLRGDENDADLPDADIEITGTDDGSGSSYAFDAPSSIESGEVNIRFTNGGTEGHEVGLVRVPDGTTVEQVLGVFSGETAPPPGFDAVSLGGVQGIDPGASQIATLDLKRGSYVLICGIPSAEGVPHAFLGMARLLSVD